MCDQTEICYSDEEVVWVKLGTEWWPGAVVGREKLPPDMLDSFKKPPIAVVKFFEEDTYEYVKNINSIYKYNCSRKHEFIKKGLDHCRSNKSHMEKFPVDVSQAERLTGGEPDIVQREEFRPASKRESYAGIFGDTPSAKKGTPASAKKGKNKGSPVTPTKLMQTITHPRILKKFKDGTSDYKAHILVQPSPTDNNRRISTASEHDDLPTHTPLSPSEHSTTNISTPIPTPTPTNTQHSYSCHACPFTSARLNVMVFHTKSHSATFTPYKPSHSLIKCAKISPEKKITPKNKKESPQVKTKPKARKVDLDIQPSASRGVTIQKKTESPPKRKGTKLKDKNAKKVKTDMEIKNSLLADWSEDSSDSINLLTSLELTENTISHTNNDSGRDFLIPYKPLKEVEKVLEAVVTVPAEELVEAVKQLPAAADKIPEVIDEAPTTEEKIPEAVAALPKDLQDNEKVVAESEKTAAIIETKFVEKTKVLPVSCFDFQEDEDWPVDADVGRKIPRVNLKNDIEPARKLSERDLEAEILEKRLSKEGNEKRDEEVKGLEPEQDLESREDLVSEIDNLLEETTVPQLPSVPQTHKFQENFPEPKTVKFPDKRNSKEEKPLIKTIFKTKTFFRSRHSRSQDAIEKYVADNTAIDKPTWMEKSVEKDTDDTQSDHFMDSGEVRTESELLDPELSLSLQLSPPPLKETVKIPKLAPKIQLKKMKSSLLKDFYTEDKITEGEKCVEMEQVVRPEKDIDIEERDEETASALASIARPTNDMTNSCPFDLIDPVQDFCAQSEKNETNALALSSPIQVECHPEETESPDGDNILSEVNLSTAKADNSSTEVDYRANSDNGLEENNCPVELDYSSEEGNKAVKEQNYTLPEVDSHMEEVEYALSEVEKTSEKNNIHIKKVNETSEEIFYSEQIQIRPSMEEIQIHPEEKEMAVEETHICTAELDLATGEIENCSVEKNTPAEDLDISPAEKDISAEEVNLSTAKVHIHSKLKNICPVKVGVRAAEIDIYLSEVHIPKEEIHNHLAKSDIHTTAIDYSAATVEYSTNEDDDQNKLDVSKEIPNFNNEVVGNELVGDKSASYNISADDETDVLDQTDFSIKEVVRHLNPVESVVPIAMKNRYVQESQLGMLIEEKFEDHQGMSETMLEEFPDTPGAVEEVSVNTSEETETEPELIEPHKSDNESLYNEEYPLKDNTICSNGVSSMKPSVTIRDLDSEMSAELSIDTTNVCNKSRISDKSPSESDLQIAETLINLPASTISNISNVDVAEEKLQDVLTPIMADEEMIKMSSVETKEAPKTLEPPVCSAMSNAQEKNAAESLMQMFNTIEQPSNNIISSDVLPELTPIHRGQAKNEFSFDYMSDEKIVTEKPVETIMESKNPPSTKLQKMLEASSIPPNPRPANSTLKILSSKIIPKMNKEKIINFDADTKESKLQTVNPQKQKIIIRRKTPSHKNSIEGLSEPRNKFILSSPSDRAESDTIPTYTIQNSADPANIMLHPKTNRRNTKAKQQKLVAKPQNTIITSTGMLLQSGSTSVSDDSIFDINSMPIVLSDEILTPENIEKMPIVMSDGKVLPQQSLANSKVKHVAKDIEKVTVAEKSKPSPVVTVAKSEVAKNIIIKPTAEKTPSPNILSKSSKVKSGKPMLIVDKNTGEQKILMGKAEHTSITGNKDNKQMIFKHGPTLITQPGVGGKMEKFLILPPGANQTLLPQSNKRQPKIIVNPQTGKAHMLISKPADLPELSTASVSNVKPNTTKVFQSKQGSESTNTVMIITNPQGGQQKIVLTPEHEKILFPKKSNLITQQTIVTSKGGLLSPVTARSTVVSAHSIITSKGLITSTPSTLITSKGQLIQSQSPKLISKQRTHQSAIITSKGHLIIPGAGTKRTIYTSVPGQALLTSKGQLLTPQQIPMTSTIAKVLPSNVKSTLPTQLSKVGKNISKVPKLQVASLPPQLPKPIVTSSLGKPTTTFAPTYIQTNLPSPNTTKERMILLQQKNGAIMQLTTAQFEHLQKTGQLVHKPPPTAVKTPDPKPQKEPVVLKKYSNKASLKSEKAKPTLTPIKHKIITPQPSQPLEKKQRLRELLTFKQDAKNKLLPEPKPKYGLTSNPIQVPHIDLNNLDDLIPATLIDARSRDTSYLNNSNISSKQPSPIKQPSPVKPAKNTNNEGQSLIFSALAHQETAQPSVVQKMDVTPQPQPAVTDNQLLAVPGENFGGPPNSFYLCVEENGTLTPIDNQPLVLENNQLVPMIAPIPVPEPIAVPPLAHQAHLHPESTPTLDERVQQMLTLPGDPHQNILINTGDQQIILDQQTLLSLLGSDGQQQLITADGQQLVLQGNVHQLLQALLPAQQHQHQTAVWTQQQQAPNRDILAAALANTDVFQQDLAVATCAGESLPGSYHPHPTVHNVSATSPALHQPIMSPLEVPTKKELRDRNDAQHPQNLLGQDLEQSLAVIGVTAPNIPTSLELPITVTNPQIAPKTTNPLNLSCGSVYAGAAITNSLVSPGSVPDTDGRINLVEFSKVDNAPKCDSNSSVNVKYMNPGMEECELTSGHTLFIDKLKSSTDSFKGHSIIGQTFNLGDEKAPSSMPCLDDSSSDSFMDESTNVNTTIETKTYSPISMPILTEDSQDGQKLQFPSLGSKSMPSLLDDRSQDAHSPSVNFNMNTAQTSLNMPQLMGDDSMEEQKDMQIHRNSNFAIEADIQVESKQMADISKSVKQSINVQEAMDFSESTVDYLKMDIQEEAVCNEVILDACNIEVTQVEIQDRANPEQSIVTEEITENNMVQEETHYIATMMDIDTGLSAPDKSVLASTSSSRFEENVMEEPINGFGGENNLREELRIETSSSSTQGGGTELLTPDSIAPTPPPGSVESHPFSDTSTDGSDEIPIQPDISVSQQTVQHFSALVNNNSVSPPEVTASPAPDRTSPLSETASH